MPWLAFGAATAGAISLFGAEFPSAFDRLLLGTSLASLIVATVWIACLAIRRGGAWAWAFALGVWIPYVNFVIAAEYARGHWREGAARPGWLALGGIVAQLLLSVRVLFAAPPPLA
jgi:hypothetical protein